MKTSLLFPENAISGNLRWQASWHLAQKMGTDTLYVKGFVRKMSLVLFSSQIPFMLQGQLAFHNTAKFFRQSTQKAVLTPVLQAVPSPPVTNDFELQMTFVCPRARKFPSTWRRGQSLLPAGAGRARRPLHTAIERQLRRDSSGDLCLLNILQAHHFALVSPHKTPVFYWSWEGLNVGEGALTFPAICLSQPNAYTS